MRAVTVPSSLLTALDGRTTRRAAPPSCLRVLVTVWVLAGDRSLTRAEFRELGYRARALWPEQAFRRQGRLSVLSVLLELDALGVVSGVEACEDGFRCVVREERAA